jgi:hypothetical protein
MFVGHLAVALGAKRAAPNVNLAWLMAGVTALDLIWPIFMITGVEHATIAPGATAFTPIVFDSYPWSHSLVMAAAWGLVLVAIARAARVQVSSGLLVALVASHWVLDFVTHAPDMPLWPGDSPRYGLTLWNSIPGTLIIEGAMWIAGIAVYMGVVRQSGRRQGWPFWSFVALCTVMWVTSPFSPPPPSAEFLGWFGLIGWIIIPWTAWADRQRNLPESTNKR